MVNPFYLTAQILLMKKFTLSAVLILLAFFSFGQQNCPGNILTDSHGYYGGFESGNYNFTSTTGHTDLSYGSNHGAYQIVDDVNNAGGGGYLDIKPHSGNYFMLIHTDDSRLWYTAVSVTPGATYSFCAYIASAKHDPTAGFEVRLRVKAGSTTTVIGSYIAKQGVWSQVCGTYTVPANVTSIELQIVDPFPDGISNFLALDDICFRNTSGSFNPDINVTYVNVSVPGNVNTNDAVPAGTTYGTPILNSKPAGSTATITMNPNGTYTFVANTVGVYTYNVPVCVPGQAPPCPTSLLTITVLGPNVINPPVANTDIATTKVNTPVTLNSLANDKAGYPGGTLNPASVTVITAPLHGTTSVNPATGAITYTPAAGFVGMDTLTYRVCDNSAPPLCATAKQIITIEPANAVNTTTAADDYATTQMNTAVSGNVKNNDSDPEGNTQTVTAQTTTVAGKGTLVLNSDGTFTFTPVTGFTGPVSFVYTTCDNGVPQACANATLYIIVTPPSAPKFNPDINVTYVNVSVPGNVNTNDAVPAGTTYGTPILNSKPVGSTATLTMSSNGSYTFIADMPGVYVYNVPVCVPGQAPPCPTSLLTITVLAPNTNNPPVANTDIATTKVNTPVTLNSLSNDKAGYPGGTLNPASVTVITAPLHGTTSVNPATGAITYTPAAGFVGMDTLTYRVCDNSAPPLCATAKQIITIEAANATNTTVAADDYATTPINTAVSGNVKTNDSDPDGNTQTVTAQTTTAAGKGTLVLNSDGTFTFTPVTGFTGPVSFVYTTCDNGVPQACANATLYITVVAVPDLTPRINLNPNNIIGTSSMEITVQVNEINNVPTNGSLITMYVDKQNLFSNFTFNSAQTTNAAGQPVQNSLFTIDAVSNPDFYVITTNAVFVNSLRRVTFSVTVKPAQTKGSTPINVLLKNGSGGETNFTNNSNFTILTFSF